jgi:hypothetical protein
LIIGSRDLLHTFVLNEISDDYERFEKIEGECKALASKCGFSVDSHAVLSALTDLIARGLVKAVRLSSRDGVREIDGVPLDVYAPGVCFFQTEDGKRAHASSVWPFDDGGELLPDIVIASYL